MSNLRQRFPPLGTVVALITAIFAAMQMPVTPFPTDVAPRTPEADDVLQGNATEEVAPTLHVIQDLDDTLWIRPLFAEGRRPPAIKVVEQVVEPEPEPEIALPLIEVPLAAVAPPPPAVRMVGSMSMNGALRALVVVGGNNAEVWVETGQVFEGWMLTKISQAAIELTYDTTKITIQLFD